MRESGNTIWLCGGAFRNSLQLGRGLYCSFMWVLEDCTSKERLMLTLIQKKEDYVRISEWKQILVKWP